MILSGVLVDRLTIPGLFGIASGVALLGALLALGAARRRVA